ncbi:MAG: hypothetical protein L0241_15210 [Planctomycetia bacterium]|nr:hypothetical protein [Planctomycetia bacterium]
MTLAEKLLQKLSDWRPAGDGRHSWSCSFPEEGWTIHLTADRADTLSCLAWEFTLTRTGSASEGLTLRNWAENIAKRASGLMEPLKVLEVDEARGEAVLRSDSPAKKGERVMYYEVRLFGLTTAIVRRFAATRTAGGREQIPFALTHESLAKLANDIVG